MFRIINFLTLIRYIAVAATIISVGAYELLRNYWMSDLPIIRILSITPWVVIVILFFITNKTITRMIWGVMSYFNTSLYPDLNGTWGGEVIFEDGKTIEARAVIRQTLLQTQIDLHTATSKSITLETTPAEESGQLKLYYSYRSSPKNISWKPYTGSTIFDVRTATQEPKRPLELSGYYFTDRKTTGRVRLQLISKENSADVSFY
ncbi:hypothetical protein E0H59_18280 [Rhizobium leguminosarum bv. viciae]|uniref:Cap15 family cyclic dinucleotide receptor domain-containing protein n=1 Tax=Rhizobium ruizarguesonis TaxID=2081791 RepID=UPI00103D21E1|nr:hypothetical protein [Rhizobium ruizarguesonis]MBY5806097.1 hypothetical protein [Rhizobium leguminosarum]TBY53328.1 hypothetical protein E0H59_18280 [Rhizobium leguminosarum bv. viciae]MBY5846865.1 hypothetical protein [Rhizobium leguminosarum]NEH87938.1 hypothetical protein [Rhizobium ruizarguesonis]NEJ58077.1 hypothetical protein [Rhizobium ruizarguesonis]